VLKIVLDENIPGAEELFGPFGEVRKLPGRRIGATDVLSADILLVRSVTRVDEQLLAGSQVRFVGSCTTGVDHIDQQYLGDAGIAFAHAPGANAQSVVEYVLSALCRLAIDSSRVEPGMSVGIVGLGNVGGRLYRLLSACGFHCIGYDPLIEPPPGFTLAESLAQVLCADIVSLHTPLTRSGRYATAHMLGAEQLAALPVGGILINSSRGAVVDNQALSDVLKRRRDLAVVLDVWEREPVIDLELMHQVTLATPHIAGYSYDGKLLGSKMVADALANWVRGQVRPKTGTTRDNQCSPPAKNWPELCQAMLAVYDIAQDDSRMRKTLASAVDPGVVFEQLRREYPIRHEAGFGQ
jgi:erythronate-4-phosphate dehydrogenase